MADALLTIKNALTSGWLNANTDSITPTIDVRMHYKELDLANNDYVFVYSLGGNHSPFGIGALDWEQEMSVTIDFWTTYKTAAFTDVRAHLIKMREEILRIMKANVRDPDSNFKLLLTRRENDHSDKTAGIGRMTFDVTLWRWGS